jgi:hypothetical protein
MNGDLGEGEDCGEEAQQEHRARQERGRGQFDPAYVAKRYSSTLEVLDDVKARLRKGEVDGLICDEKAETEPGRQKRWTR